MEKFYFEISFRFVVANETDSKRVGQIAEKSRLIRNS